MDLAKLVESAEMDAWADLVRAAPAPIVNGLGIELHEIGGALAVVTRRLDNALFNRVIGLGLKQPATREGLQAIADLYRPLTLSNARLHVSPGAEPAEGLNGWLSDLGFVRAAVDSAKVVRETEAPPEVITDLTIVQAEAANSGLFGATISVAYGLPTVVTPWLQALVGRPDWRCYLAYDGDRAVSAAVLHLGESHGWLGLAATRAYASGRGGHRALLARRLTDAAQAGKTLAIGETVAPSAEEPSPSHANLLRGGFRLVHTRASYVI